MNHPYNSSIASKLVSYFSALRRANVLQTAKEMSPYIKVVGLIRVSQLDISSSKDREQLLGKINDLKVRSIVERLSAPRNPKSVEELVAEATAPKLRVVKPEGETKTA